MIATVAESRMHFGSCGLGGRIRVNATFPEADVNCEGELSDWDSRVCQATYQLSLNLTNCRARQFQGALAFYKGKVQRVGYRGMIP